MGKQIRYDYWYIPESALTKQFLTLLCTALASHFIQFGSYFDPRQEISDQFLKMFQQDDPFFCVQHFIPCKQLYMFRVNHSPIIRRSNKLW
jgi:hypothetical protein